MIDEKIELIIDKNLLEQAKKDNFKVNSCCTMDEQTKIPCIVKIGEKKFNAIYCILCIKDIIKSEDRESYSISVIRQLSKIKVEIHNPEENFMLFYNFSKNPKGLFVESLRAKYYIGGIEEHNFKFIAHFLEY